MKNDAQMITEIQMAAMDFLEQSKPVLESIGKSIEKYRKLGNVGFVKRLEEERARLVPAMFHAHSEALLGIEFAY
jgi:hypothetical protein